MCHFLSQPFTWRPEGHQELTTGSASCPNPLHGEQRGTISSQRRPGAPTLYMAPREAPRAHQSVGQLPQPFTWRPERHRELTRASASCPNPLHSGLRGTRSLPQCRPAVAVLSCRRASRPSPSGPAGVGCCGAQNCSAKDQGCTTVHTHSCHTYSSK